jgi:arginase family enzyme
VDAALDSGRFPVLLGGDCSIVLGPILALRSMTAVRVAPTITLTRWILTC